MKMPWIDKSLYPAVMFACKMLQNGTDYGRAVGIAARHYGVSYDDVDAEVRKRRATANKAEKAEPFHYKFFVVSQSYMDINDPDGERGKTYRIIKGKSQESVRSRLSDIEYRYDVRNQGNGGECSWSQMRLEIVGECETSEDAEKMIKDLEVTRR